ncbi:unnamed protein product [Arabidopsis halleri]
MVFTGFGGWVTQNNEQPRKAKHTKKAENVESKSEPEMDTNDDYDKMKKYYDEEEMKKQDQLWIDAEKNHPWNDAPPNVKENKSRKVLMEDGPRQIAKVKKTVDWKFLGSSFAVPISVIVDENRKDLTAKYKKKKMILMKVFEGSYKVEPLYVDSERLCKNMEPNSPEEYKRCSGGQGRIASKVTMNQYFKPYPPFNLPPLSWYIREVTIKNTKTALKTLQTWGITLRNPGVVTSTDKDGNVTKSRRKKVTNKKLKTLG